MEQSQFDTLMLAIGGLKAEIVALDTKLSSKIVALDTKIAALDTKLSSKIIAMDTKIVALDSKVDAHYALLRTGIAEIKSELVAKINAQGKEHERRIQRLEEPGI